MNPQDEAISILSKVLQDLISPKRDLLTILRQCQHICEILEWPQPKTWFQQELNGYPPDSNLPPHRRILGIKKWEYEGPHLGTINFTNTSTRFISDAIKDIEEPDILEVRAGITWLQGASQLGYNEIVPETRNSQSLSTKESGRFHQVRKFPSANFTYSLTQIESQIFDWASSNYVSLNYGKRVFGIWERYQTNVESALQRFNLINHLAVINGGIGSDNPESWRTAVFECRNLLNDLANQLWQDTRDTYIRLPGKGPEKKLDVRQGNYANRLAAFLHQQQITGKEGEFLRGEGERLADSIRSLISLASMAHNPIEKSLADTIVLFTYFLIGELSIKTDLSPIHEYK